MTRWLLLAGIAAMLAACASADGRGLAAVEQPRAEGQSVAALLGYHGPVNRMAAKYGD